MLIGSRSTMSREDFVNWLDNTVDISIPENFQEFSLSQLRDYAFDVIFSALDEKGFVPADIEEPVTSADR